QDISDLLSSILRIDVNHEADGKPYAVPPDNPFLKTPGARPEVWAYGFRNPWRMSFDRDTGDLWVGDVGWELWEMVYHVQKGGNYGWSVMEGPQAVRPDSRRGPTPILPPALAFPHTEAASITGGYVYHGKRLPELQGVYVCGDWVTRKLWGARFERPGKRGRAPAFQGSRPLFRAARLRTGRAHHLAQGAGPGDAAYRRLRRGQRRRAVLPRLRRRGHDPAAGAEPGGQGVQGRLPAQVER